MKLLTTVLVVFAVSHLSESRLEPTKLVSGQVFRLQNQHDGRYLAATPNGFARQEYSGSPNQKFLFSLVEGNDVWTLTPQGDNSNSIRYQISYVGHGKYQFRNLATNMCLYGGSHESKCDKNEPTVRWFVDTISSS